MALSAAASLFIPALGGDAGTGVVTITVWLVLAWALSRGLRVVRVPQRIALGLAITIGLIATIIGLGLILYHTQTSPNQIWFATLGEDIAAGKLSLSGVIVIAITLLGAWGLGSLEGFHTPTLSGTAISFQVGLVVVLFSFGLAAVLGLPMPYSVVLSVAFCFFGMLSIAINHRYQQVGKISKEAEQSWLTVLIIGLVLALLVGALISILISPELMHVVTTFIGKVVTTIRELVGQLLAYLTSFDKHSPAQNPLAIPTYDPDSAKQPEQSPNELGDLIGKIVSIVSIAGIAIIVGLALLKYTLDFLQLLSRRRNAPAHMSVEKISDSWGFELRAFLGMLRELRKIPRWLINALFHRQKQTVANDEPPLATEVRDTYRKLLHMTSQRGLRRKKQETPHEYLRRLSATIPAVESDLQTLTEHYNLARYYPQSLTEVNCRDARESWQRLRKQLHGWVAPNTA
jgi:hypothetical protein